MLLLWPLPLSLPSQVNQVKLDFATLGAVHDIRVARLLRWQEIGAGAATSASSQGQQQQGSWADWPPVVLGPGEIDRYIRASDIPRAFYARRFLTALRDRHRATQNDVFLHDLTDSQEFDWKAWVSERPDAEAIVGPGICGFAFVWLPNSNGEFLVQRSDDVNICLRRELTFEAISFLVQEEATWYARPHPRGRFRRDITGGVSAAASSQRQFQWLDFVQQRKWYRFYFQVPGFEITAFEVAWSSRWRHAVFLGHRDDGNTFTVNPQAHSQVRELSWHTDDIAELDI